MNEMDQNFSASTNYCFKKEQVIKDSALFLKERFNCNFGFFQTEIGKNLRLHIKVSMDFRARIEAV